MRANKLIWSLILLSLFFTAPSVRAVDNNAALEKPRMRMLAPDFSLPDINPVSSNALFRLSDLKGKLVIINFWSLDCTPCLEEMESLNKLAIKYYYGLRIVAISVNRSIRDVREYQRKNNWSFRILMDVQRKVRKQYEIDAIPTSYMIGADGRFIARIRGSRNWYSTEIQQKIKLLIKSGSGSGRQTGKTPTTFQ